MTEETGTEVANFFGGSVSVSTAADLAADIQKSAQQDPRGNSDGSDFLNFSGKRGRYTIGQDGRVIDNDELWIVNIASFEDGYICWKAAKPAATRMANIRATPVPAPKPDELGPFDGGKGEGWFQAKGMVLRSVENDQQGYFKINSLSGVSAFAGLQKLVGERAIAGQPAWPVVQLDMEEFESQGYKNFKPVFTFYGWLDDENVQKLADPDSDVDELIAASTGVAAVAHDSEAKPRRRRKL